MEPDVSRAMTVLACVLCAGCAATPSPPPAARDYRLVVRDGLLVFEARPQARFVVTYRGPDRPQTGERVMVEICVPDALPGERHDFRIIPARPTVRLLGPERFQTVGTECVQVYFTSDAAGPGAIVVECK